MPEHCEQKKQSSEQLWRNSCWSQWCPISFKSVNTFVYTTASEWSKIVLFMPLLFSMVLWGRNVKFLTDCSWNICLNSLLVLRNWPFLTCSNVLVSSFVTVSIICKHHFRYAGIIGYWGSQCSINRIWQFGFVSVLLASWDVLHLAWCVEWSMCWPLLRLGLLVIS